MSAPRLCHNRFCNKPIDDESKAVPCLFGSQDWTMCSEECYAKVSKHVTLHRQGTVAPNTKVVKVELALPGRTDTVTITVTIDPKSNKMVLMCTPEEAGPAGEAWAWIHNTKEGKALGDDLERLLRVSSQKSVVSPSSQ